MRHIRGIYIYQEASNNRHNHHANTPQYIVGRGGPLVESAPFERRVVVLNSALPAMYGLWASPSPTVDCSASACKLRNTVNKLLSGALLKGSCREKRYENG